VAAARGQHPVVVHRRHVNADRFPVLDGVATDLDFRREPGPTAPGLADLVGALRERAVNVVHVHFGYDLPLARAVAVELDVPIVVSFHGNDASSYLLRPEWEAFYRRVLPDADRIVLDYMGMAARLVRLGAVASRISVIATGIDVDFWKPIRRPARKSGPIRLLSVGRLVEKKGHYLLFHALAQAVAGGIDLTLDLIGQGEEERILRELSLAYGLDERIRFLGALDRAEVRAHMEKADLFVLASHRPPHGDEETTPLVLKEALATGLPVLSTRHAGIPQIVRDGLSGVLVEEGSVDALLSGLRRLVRLRERWPEMGRAGRSVIREDFNLDLTLDQWARLYADAASLSIETAAPPSARGAGRVPRVAHLRAEFVREGESSTYDHVVAAHGQQPVLVYRKRSEEKTYRLPRTSVEARLDFSDPGLGLGNLLRRLRSESIDVVHAHAGWDLPLAAAIARTLDRPLIASFHGADSSSYLARPRWPDLYRQLLPGVDVISVDHVSQVQPLVEHGADPGRIRVIPRGIDIARWKTQASAGHSRGMRLVAGGPLVEKKGFHILLHALAAAVRGGLDATLTIAGEGPDHRLLAALVQAYGLRSWVSFAGGSRPTLLSLFAQADAYVLPSLTAADGDSEPWPPGLIEAMAARLPVLSTDHAGIPEIVADGVTGFLVRAADTDALRLGLERLAAARSRWREMGRCGARVAAERHSSRTSLEIWRTVYGELAGGGSRLR